MTDQQHYTSSDSPLTLKIDAARGWGVPGHVLVALGRSGEDPRTHYGMHVPTAHLLAMIDAEDPDAMRAYLRETLMHEDRENLRAYLEPEQLDAVPEADSPEDVDEQPELVLTVTPEALAVAEQLGRYVAAIGDAYRRGLTR